MKKTVRGKLMTMILALVMTISLVPATTANAEVITEQFTLAPGGTYYFDLSSKRSDMKYDDTATINPALPDGSLKWVPFTYAGTVNAYSRTNEGVSTDGTVVNGYRSLFISDYAVSTNVSWDGLNGKGLIFGDGDGNYTSNGISYNLRSLSAGSAGNGQSGDALRGIPQTNEWDQVLNKNSSYIKYQASIFCWGQDTLGTTPSRRVGRSWNFVRYFGYNGSSYRDAADGFRPTLEILNAGSGMKTVTYDMGENGKIGSGAGSLTQASVVYAGTLTLPQVTEANGFYYTGTEQEGMTLGWLSGDGDFYAAGTSLSSLPTESILTAGYGVTGVTVTPSSIEIEKGDSRQFTAIVSGSGTYSQAVNWTVEGATSSGTKVDANGLLTIAADETVSTLTFKAVSVQNENIFGTAAVTITIAAAPIVPTVTTASATGVTDSGATLNGNVTNEGDATVTERGFVYGTSANPAIDGSKVVADLGTGTGTFSATLSGLTAGTTYHVSAYATSGAGTAYGEVRTFTTQAGGASAGRSSGTTVPKVKTAEVSRVTASGATLTGSVGSMGGGQVTARGFVIGTAPDPELGGTDVINIQVSGGTGSFTATVDSLLPATTYYVRAYAVNVAGVGYGQNIPLATGYLGDGKNAIPKTGDAAGPWAFVVIGLAACAGYLVLRRCRV